MRQRSMRTIAQNQNQRSVYQDYQSTTQQLAAVALSQPPKNTQAWQEQVANITARRDELERQLAIQSESFMAAQKRPMVRELIESLGTDQALVDYWEYESLDESNPSGKEDALVAFVVRRDHEITRFRLGSASEVYKALERWRDSKGDGSRAIRAGKLLRNRLWEPLLDALGDAKTVLISPDGMLGKLPFHALPGKKQGTYLLEDYRLALIPVPRMLPQLASSEESSQANHELLLVGGVDYDRMEKANPPAETLAATTIGFGTRGTQHTLSDLW